MMPCRSSSGSDRTSSRTGDVGLYAGMTTATCSKRTGRSALRIPCRAQFGPNVSLIRSGMAVEFVHAVQSPSHLYCTALASRAPLDAEHVLHARSQFVAVG